MTTEQKCIACMCQPLPDCRNPWCPAREPQATGQGDYEAVARAEFRLEMAE